MRIVVRTEHVVAEGNHVVIGLAAAAFVGDEREKNVAQAMSRDLFAAAMPDQTQRISIGQVAGVIGDAEEVEAGDLDGVAVGVVDGSVDRHETEREVRVTMQIAHGQMIGTILQTKRLRMRWLGRVVGSGRSRQRRRGKAGLHRARRRDGHFGKCNATR